MSDRKRRYIHICGKSGLGFAVWLYRRLSQQGIETALADCSTDSTLITYTAGLAGINGVAVPAEKWTIGHVLAENVIFYHEQEDLYTDLAEGIYLFFAQQRELPYIKALLEKLTDGTLCLFEPLLMPQLQKGRRTYLLILNKRNIEGEYFIPAELLDTVAGPYEELLEQILSKSMLPYLSS